MIRTVQKSKISGAVRVPSSKSDTQRALLLAALTQGKSILQNPGKSGDELAMMQAVQQLGAKITQLNEREIQIEGITQIPEINQISMEESGLGFRLMASVLALFDKKTTLLASGSLLQRPMGFFEEILPRLGAQVNSNNGFPPLEIRGPIHGNEITVDGSLSSQFLSGLLIALPFAEGDSLIHVRELKSIPYIDMTLRTLEKFGIKIEHTDYGKFTIKGGQQSRACHYAIEGDWSSASYWLTAAALGMDITVQNLDMESLQADRMITEVFRQANCTILNDVNGIRVNGTQRRAFEADLTHAPDLFPALAAFASLTPGKSILYGTERLLHKESNRAASILEEFSKLGCKIQLRENTMHIEGISHINGCGVDSHHDHRIAMSLAVLGLFSENPVTIHNAESVAKSYPSFWEDLSLLEG
ncbi:MAG: 3-phosphoshikimate 1-carboxyvinyltransferase [Crocinitomicaceae bacterium]|jgi:3-phosphoshikimate 1-carboxyvinyltransferase|nr:3-phosphoshikimate 1-carboxyvinyltransferase [Crocinitomicaceae bacterium]